MAHGREKKCPALTVYSSLAAEGQGHATVADVMGIFSSTHQYVVRVGMVRASTLIAGTTPHCDRPELTGFSVQSALGVSVEKLAKGGQFLNPKISVTTRARLQRHGFKIVFPTPRKGLYHATVAAPYPLSPDLADDLSRLFDQYPNPHPVRKQGR